MIKQIVQNDKLGAPKSSCNTFITQYNSNSDNSESSNAPEKNTVKRKISYLKTKYKYCTSCNIVTYLDLIYCGLIFLKKLNRPLLFMTQIIWYKKTLNERYMPSNCTSGT